MEILKKEAELVCHVWEWPIFSFVSFFLSTCSPPFVLPLTSNQMCYCYTHFSQIMANTSFPANAWLPWVANFNCNITYFFLVWQCFYKQNLSKACKSKQTFCDAVYPEYAPHACSLVTYTNRHIITVLWDMAGTIILNYRCKTKMKILRPTEVFRYLCFPSKSRGQRCLYIPL